MLLNRFQFDFAKPADDQAILNLLEESELPGKISLLYTRRPSPLNSYKIEGGQSHIMVVRDLENNRLVSTGVCTVHNVYLDSGITVIGYLSGFRVAEEYKKRLALVPSGFRFLLNNPGLSTQTRFFTTILEHNSAAITLLEKKNRKMPVYHFKGNFNVFALSTKKNRKFPQYRLERASHENKKFLLEYYQKEGKRHDFFPVLSADELNQNMPGLENFYLLFNSQNELVAAGAVWDQTLFKQHIVKNYTGMYKTLQPFSFLLPWFGYPALPRKNSTLNFFTLSFCLIRDKDPDIFEIFLFKIKNLGCNYDYFLTGLTDTDSMIGVIQKQRHLLYKSRIYEVFKNLEMYEEAQNLEYPVDYLECARL